MAGPGSGLGGTGPNPAVPPASHINTQPPSAGGGGGSGGGGSRLAGRAERAVGSLVGSQALKEKGFQKEQEAGAFKTQSAEIAEAERLEKEALMRRERAVAHGESCALSSRFCAGDGRDANALVGLGWQVRTRITATLAGCRTRTRWRT